MTLEPRVRLAVPNKGRLEEPTARLLHDAGIQFEATMRALTVPARNVPLELLFVRTEDVVELVADGVADVGVTGLDVLAESGTDLEVLAELGFGRCRLAGAVPKDSPYDDPSDFAGLRVATSHPRVTNRFFEAKGVDVQVIALRGSVEVAPKLDVADAIVDLVSSGSTMMVNGLRPVVTLLESQAVLVAGSVRPDVRDTVAQLTTMIRAVVAGRRKRYLLLNAAADRVAEIDDLIPGIDAPSVVPLSHAGPGGEAMVAIHSVVDAADLWTLLPKLSQVGASGILVLPIEQLIP